MNLKLLCIPIPARSRRSVLNIFSNQSLSLISLMETKSVIIKNHYRIVESGNAEEDFSETQFIVIAACDAQSSKEGKCQ